MKKGNCRLSENLSKHVGNAIVKLHRLEECQIHRRKNILIQSQGQPEEYKEDAEFQNPINSRKDNPSNLEQTIFKNAEIKQPIDSEEDMKLDGASDSEATVLLDDKSVSCKSDIIVVESDSSGEDAEYTESYNYKNVLIINEKAKNKKEISLNLKRKLEALFGSMSPEQDMRDDITHNYDDEILPRRRKKKTKKYKRIKVRSDTDEEKEENNLNHSQCITISNRNPEVKDCFVRLIDINPCESPRYKQEINKVKTINFAKEITEENVHCKKNVCILESSRNNFDQSKKLGSELAIEDSKSSTETFKKSSSELLSIKDGINLKKDEFLSMPILNADNVASLSLPQETIVEANIPEELSATSDNTRQHDRNTDSGIVSDSLGQSLVSPSNILELAVKQLKAEGIDDDLTSAYQDLVKENICTDVHTTEPTSWPIQARIVFDYVEKVPENDMESCVEVSCKIKAVSPTKCCNVKPLGVDSVVSQPSNKQLNGNRIHDDAPLTFVNVTRSSPPNATSSLSVKTVTEINRNVGTHVVEVSNKKPEGELLNEGQTVSTENNINPRQELKAGTNISSKTYQIESEKHNSGENANKADSDGVYNKIQSAYNQINNQVISHQHIPNVLQTDDISRHSTSNHINFNFTQPKENNTNHRSTLVQNNCCAISNQTKLLWTLAENIAIFMNEVEACKERLALIKRVHFQYNAKMLHEIASDGYRKSNRHFLLSSVHILRNIWPLTSDLVKTIYHFTCRTLALKLCHLSTNFSMQLFKDVIQDLITYYRMNSTERIISPDDLFEKLNTVSQGTRENDRFTSSSGTVNNNINQHKQLNIPPTYYHSPDENLGSFSGRYEQNSQDLTLQAAKPKLDFPVQANPNGIQISFQNLSRASQFSVPTTNAAQRPHMSEQQQKTMINNQDRIQSVHHHGYFNIAGDRINESANFGSEHLKQSPTSVPVSGPKKQRQVKVNTNKKINNKKQTKNQNVSSSTQLSNDSSFYGPNKTNVAHDFDSTMINHLRHNINTSVAYQTQTPMSVLYQEHQQQKNTQPRLVPNGNNAISTSNLKNYRLHKQDIIDSTIKYTMHNQHSTVVNKDHRSNDLNKPSVPQFHVTPQMENPTVYKQVPAYNHQWFPKTDPVVTYAGFQTQSVNYISPPEQHFINSGQQQFLHNNVQRLDGVMNTSIPNVEVIPNSERTIQTIDYNNIRPEYCVTVRSQENY